MFFLIFPKQIIFLHLQQLPVSRTKVPALKNGIIVLKPSHFYPCAMRTYYRLFTCAVLCLFNSLLQAQQPETFPKRTEDLPFSNTWTPVLKYFDPAADKAIPNQGAAPELARCDNPINLQCGVPLLNQSNNTGVASQFNYIDYKNGCIGSAQTNGWTGPERLYRFTLAEQSSVHIIMDIKTAGVDLDVFLLTSCQPFSCYAFSLETSSHEMVDVNLPAGTYYILVDGFNTGSIATFDLSLNCTCTCIETPGDLPTGKVLYCDNFQDYKNNLSIDAQSTRWNGFGGNSDDAVTEQSGSNLYARFRGTGSGSTTYDPDMNYYLDEKETGRYRISWRMRVENGRAGNFAVLHERASYAPAPSGNVWAYEVNFNTDGTGTLRPGTANGSNDEPFIYPKATWFSVVNLIDLNKDSAELWINNTFVSKWRFSLGYDAINQLQLADLKRLAALNFYGPPNYDFAIDDICVWMATPPCSGGTGESVCTGSGSKYGNEGSARCDLFTSKEFDDCLTVCDYGGTFIYRGDNFTGVLDNSDLAAGFIKNDPCVRSAYGNNFPNPLYADIYIFYKNDNDIFNVGLNNGGNSQIKKFVFSCRSNPGCSVNKQTCLTEVSGTGYSPAACNNTYYIVVTGPAGSSYTLNVIPNGPCGTSFTEITPGQTLTGSGSSVNSAFSKAGGAYNSCYAGTRTYSGGEKVYRFTLNGQKRAILTLTPQSPSNARMGMFLYSFLCGQQCVTYAENTATGGTAVINQSLGEGTHYVVVDSDAGNPTFTLNLEYQQQTTITHYVIDEKDVCVTGQVPNLVTINDYCACKGMDQTQPHQVVIRAPDSNFGPTDQIQFLYNNQLGEPSPNILYQKDWKVVPVGSTEPNASFELGADSPTDGVLKCAYTNTDPFQLYLTQKVSGQDHLRRLTPTYSTGAGTTSTGTFQNNALSVINSLRITGDPIHFISSSRYENPPPTAGSREIQISSNGPWTMQKTPGPGFSDASWLTVSIPPGAGTGAGTDEITLSYPEYNSAYPRVAVLTFTYTRQTNFKIVVRVEQQGVCVPANVSINATPEVVCGGTAVTLSAQVGQFNGQSLADLYNYSWSSGQTTAAITETLSANATRTVTVTNKYNYCPNTGTSTRTITVGQAPTAAINSNASVCTGGTLTLTATGGTAYNWSTNATGSSISPMPTLGNSTYTVTVTNAAGCTASATRSISLLDPPNVVIASVNAVCAGQNVSLSASGGGTYAWSTGTSTANITPIPLAPASTYTVTVTGTNGCTNTATRQVVVNPAPSASIDAPSAVCAGATANLSASGPAGATFLWSTGATTANINPSISTASTYTVTVTLGACTTSSSTTVNLRPPAILSVAKTDATCGLPTGSATVTVTSGIGPFQYAWSTGASTATVNGLAAGGYLVTVTDNNGCTATASTTIGNSNGPSASASAPAGQTICAGRTAGLVATATGGVGPYTYVWSNNATTANTTVSPSNTTLYTVTIRDINGCTAAAQVNIAVNPAPTPNITGNNAVCQGASLPLNGVGGIQYNWSTGQTNPSIVLSPTSPLTIGLTVTDANGCTAATTRAISISPLPSANINGNTTVCAGDGTVLTASGGLAYTWNTGQSNPVVVLNPSNTTTYTVTVTNDFGCSATATKTVVVTPVPLVNIVGNNVLCAGAMTTLTASGGTVYVWNTGQSGASVSLSPTTNTVYTVTVTSNGCLATASRTVTVNPVPTAGISGITAICVGAGTVLNAFGGAAYAWNTGSAAPSLPVSPTVTTTYTVTVTNELACTATASATVTLRPVATVNINKNDAACGLPTGSAAAQVSGGTGPFTYFWSNGASAGNLGNLPAGFYGVTVTDANTCTATANTTIANSNGPSVNVSGSQAFCLGGSALLRAEVSGGTQPYTYSWSNGNTNGSFSASPAVTTTYTVTVRDANGCTAVSPAIVTVNPAPTPNIIGNNAVCAGSSAILTALGGIGFQWSNGDTNASISPVINTGTTFTVTATDANGCTATATRSVQLNPAPNVTINGNTVICAGNTAVLTATGGLVYTWNNGASNPVIPVAPTQTTTYTVTATDGNGCTATATKTVSLHPVATLTIAKTDAACGLPSGSASAAVSGGNGPFTYVWSTGANSPTINNLTAGVYTLTVIDANGCAVVGNATVGNSNGPSASIGNAPSICAGKNAQLNASATGGALPYLYAWSTGATTSVITVNPTVTSTFTVTVRDANGCTAVAQTPVAILPAPTPAISGNTNACVGAEASLSALGGSTYLWSNGATSEAITIIINTSTTFTVTATNANGCTATATRSIQADAKPEVSVLGPNALCSGQSAPLTAIGGDTYAWSTGSTTALVNVSPSTTTTYTVTATNAAGCTTVFSRTVDVNPLPSLNLTPANAACGQNNGSASVIASGGSGAYQYAWSTGATSANLSGVAAGAYTVTVRDANGCSSVGSTNIGNADGPTANAGADNAVCAGGSVILNAFANGGTPPYRYQWNTGAVSDAIPVTPATTTTYTVTVTDGANCTSVDAVTIVVNPLPPLAINGSTALCSGQTTVLTATGGIAYQWNSGATTASISVASAGLYVVTATGANNCMATASQQLILHPGVTADIDVIATLRCFGQNTGALSALPAGGTPPYNVLWSNGASQPQIGALPAGTYSVIISDQVNCRDTAFATLPPPPPALVLADTTLQNEIGGNGLGLIEVVPGGGLPPYRFVWSLNNFILPGETTAVLDSLPAGKYSLRVLDANNCGANFGPFVIDNIVGTKDPDWSSRLLLYPNPGTGRLFLRLEGTETIPVQQFGVLDVLGREIKAVTGLTLSNQAVELDLSHCPPGPYLLKIQLKQHTIVKKVWIQR